MSDPTLPTALHIGFLTVFAEATGYLGGYLVTNSWGRPGVSPEHRRPAEQGPANLYGNTLTEYLCADLVGKTLVDKTATRPT